MRKRYSTLILLTAGMLAVFVLRAMLAIHFDVPRTSNLFDALTIAGAVAILLKEHSKLKRVDWFLAASLGGVVGVGMYLSTLFSPYPFFGVIQSNTAQARVRGVFTFLATLGGLAIMRQGGLIQFHAANGDWRHSARSILVGLVTGLPLAVLKVYALQFTQGCPISWQNPIAALLDALVNSMVIATP